MQASGESTENEKSWRSGIMPFAYRHIAIFFASASAGALLGALVFSVLTALEAIGFALALCGPALALTGAIFGLSSRAQLSLSTIVLSCIAVFCLVTFAVAYDFLGWLPNKESDLGYYLAACILLEISASTVFGNIAIAFYHGSTIRTYPKAGGNRG